MSTFRIREKNTVRREQRAARSRFGAARCRMSPNVTECHRMSPNAIETIENDDIQVPT